MARGAQSDRLRKAFETHQEQTQTHVERLQQVFDILEKPACGKTWPTIDGIIEEGEEVMSASKDTPALDAVLIAAAQAVEHYEIALWHSAEIGATTGHDGSYRAAHSDT